MQKMNSYRKLLNELQSLEIDAQTHFTEVASILDDVVSNNVTSETQSLQVLAEFVDEINAADMPDNTKLVFIIQFLFDYITKRMSHLNEVHLARISDSALLASAIIPDNQKH